MLNCKKGQVAETMTWVVATVIIVVMLIVFIFISVNVSKPSGWKNIATKTAERFASDDVGDISGLKQKTTFALSADGRNSEKINGWINEKK